MFDGKLYTFHEISELFNELEKENTLLKNNLQRILIDQSSIIEKLE